MASPISVQFIDQALSPHTPFHLSYTDPHQKWLIRRDLLSLLSDHPAFFPSFDTFVHDDGTAAHLLCVTGPLQTSSSSAAAAAETAVPLTIWLHENHPFMAPIVFVSPASHHDSIRPDHPFVSISGRITCPYLQTWSHPRSSLSNLVRNLFRLFSRDHPFAAAATLSSASSSYCGFSAHPSLASRREAFDRLAGSAHYDVATFRAEVDREIDALLKLREEMVERVRVSEKAIFGLEEEKKGLQRAGTKLAEQADVVVNWLRVNDRERIEAAIGVDEVEEAFEATVVAEGTDVESEKLVLECLAADRGLEDVMYALDRAVEEGVVSFDVYIRQVRSLAREQFSHRAKLVKLRGSGILGWGYTN